MVGKAAFHTLTGNGRSMHGEGNFLAERQSMTGISGARYPGANNLARRLHMSQGHCTVNGRGDGDDVPLGTWPKGDGRFLRKVKLLRQPRCAGSHRGNAHTVADTTMDDIARTVCDNANYMALGRPLPQGCLTPHENTDAHVIDGGQ
jgi:hypothetical protein